MKRTIQSLTLTFALAATVATASGQDTIAYFSGPSFTFGGWEYEGTSLDLDRNSSPDFNFQWGPFICTADVPTSGCSSSFYVLALNTNAMLHRLSEVTMLCYGETISSATSSNTTWDDPDNYSRAAGYFFSPRYGTRGYNGPAISSGVGYLGVRFMAADGLHYGWIRLRAPNVAEFGPAVVDWAYEARPNTPIHAGDIDSSNSSQQFTVDFPDGDSGSLILSDDQLRCELTLNGQFASAKLIGPAPARAKEKPIADLGQPLVARTNYTSFFRDVTLSRGDMTKLLRGALSVSIDDGTVVGQILPLD